MKVSICGLHSCHLHLIEDLALPWWIWEGKHFLQISFEFRDLFVFQPQFLVGASAWMNISWSNIRCSSVTGIYTCVIPWGSQLFHLEAERGHLYHPAGLRSMHVHEDHHGWCSVCSTTGHNWVPTPPVSEKECVKVPEVPANRHCQILKVDV